MELKFTLGVWAFVITMCEGNIHLPGAFYTMHTNSSRLLGSELDRMVIGRCVGDVMKGSPVNENNVKMSELFSLWCSHYESLADCIEIQTSDNIPYLRFVFNSTEMKKNGRVICDRVAEIGDSINCLSNFTLNCEKNYTKALTQVKTMENACGLTYDLIPCYMNEFKVSSCKDPNILYQILDFLQVFLNPECRKWKKKADEFCTAVASSVFPERSRDKLDKYCRDFIQIQLSCFYREVYSSVHLNDRLISMELWNASFIYYREKKCRMELDVNTSCLQSSMFKRSNAFSCQNSYKEAYLNEEKRMAVGEKLTSDMMCKKHQQQVECLQNALQGCPSQTIELFVFTVCASMPVNCTCQSRLLEPLVQESSMNSSKLGLESAEITMLQLLLGLIALLWFL
ncbi:hypothetical protein CHS0354_012677 [Potamilus streckersoni]|uniref:Uncharacterized protein n=1 Tax=Potamilus streckersoni TaxID=2493646 RepID=A0AAE0SXZ9_9BIVA|nr:hypothetical protein CHS0354_012677 [Potamilus streckersoni]